MTRALHRPSRKFLLVMAVLCLGAVGIQFVRTGLKNPPVSPLFDQSNSIGGLFGGGGGGERGIDGRESAPRFSGDLFVLVNLCGG